MIKQSAFLLIFLILISSVGFAATCTIDSVDPTTIETGTPTTVTATFTDFVDAPFGDAEVSILCGDETAVITPGSLSCGAGTNGTCTFTCGTYDVAGSFTLHSLALKDTDMVPCTGEETLTVSDNTAPIATNVNVTPSNPTTLETLTCNYTYTDDFDTEGITTFKWLKGGVEEVGETNPTLDSSKTLKGELWKCEVTPLALTGPSPGTPAESAEVTIVNITPTATLIVSPTNWTTSLAITFTATCTDTDGAIESCKMDFGDGNNNFELLPNANGTFDYNYNNDGNYTAKLIATDNDGAIDDDMKNVSIDQTGPITTTLGTVNIWTNENVTVTLSCSDAGSGCDATQFRVDTVASSTATMGDWNNSANAIYFTEEGIWALDFNSYDLLRNYESTKTVSAKIDKDVNAPSITASVSNDDVTISWSAVSDSLSGIDCYEIRRSESNNFEFGDSGVTTIKSCSSQGTSTSTTDPNLDNGTYYYKVKAVDNAGNEKISGQVSATVNYNPDGGSDNEPVDDDDTPPILEWKLPNHNATVSGMVNLKVQSYDDQSFVQFVQFRVDDVTVETDRSASGERYSFDWNSETVVDGTHTLKAISKNRSGNAGDDSSVKTITVTTNNGVIHVANVTTSGTGNQNEAEQKIDEANDKKDQADLFFEELKALGVLAGADAAENLVEGTNLLDEAQELFDDGDYNGAVDKANQAKNLFEEITESSSVETFGAEQNYTYNQDHLAVLLQGLGFSQGIIDEASQTMETCESGRSLSVKRIEDGDSVYYKVVITITLENTEDTAQNIKVIEIIPKELAEMAAEVVGEGSVILVDDPVLQWEESVPANGQIELIYMLKANLSEQDAQDLLDSEILNKFVVPPVVVKAETEVSAQNFSAIGTGTGLFVLGDALALTGWIVLIVIVIGAVIFAANYFGKKDGGSGLGKTGGNGLSRVMERTGLSSNFFDRIGGSKREEPKTPKWGYKG